MASSHLSSGFVGCPYSYLPCEPRCHDHSGIPFPQRNRGIRAFSAETGFPGSPLRPPGSRASICLELLVSGQAGLWLEHLCSCHNSTSQIKKLRPRRELHAKFVICEACVTRCRGLGQELLDPEQSANVPSTQTAACTEAQVSTVCAWSMQPAFQF